MNKLRNSAIEIILMNGFAVIFIHTHTMCYAFFTGRQ